MARAAKGVPMVSVSEYEIVDARAGVRNNDLGGVRVYARDGKRYVKMTDDQAKWFLDHGTIKRA